MTETPVTSSCDDRSSAPPEAGSLAVEVDAIEAILSGPATKPCTFDSECDVTLPSASRCTAVTAEVRRAFPCSPPWPEVAAPSDVVAVLEARRWNGPPPISVLGVSGYIDPA